MAPMNRYQEVGEVLLTAIQQAQQLAQLLADNTNVSEEQIATAQLSKSKDQSFSLCNHCFSDVRQLDDKNAASKDLDNSIEDLGNNKEPHDIAEIREVNVEPVHQPSLEERTCCTSKQIIPSVPANKLSELVNAVIPTLSYLLVYIYKNKFNHKAAILN